MTEPSMTNIYLTKIKLPAAANQTSYLVIFPWVVESLYLNLYNILLILLLDRFWGYKRGSDQSRYVPINLVYELKKCEDISDAVPLRLKSGRRVPLFPHRPTPMLCRTSQSNILAKTFVVTQMGISYTKCRNPPLLP